MERIPQTLKETHYRTKNIEPLNATSAGTSCPSASSSIQLDGTLLYCKENIDMLLRIKENTVVENGVHLRPWMRTYFTVPKFASGISPRDCESHDLRLLMSLYAFIAGRIWIGWRRLDWFQISEWDRLAFCSNCRRELEPPAKFCKTCGIAVTSRPSAVRRFLNRERSHDAGYQYWASDH